jgi:hypothetical protein
MSVTTPRKQIRREKESKSVALNGIGNSPCGLLTVRQVRNM